MGRAPRRGDVRAALEESLTPPEQLTASQTVARVLRSEGHSRYSCALPGEYPSSRGSSGGSSGGESGGGGDVVVVVVELAARFRNAVYVRRGGYVLVDLAPPPSGEQQTKTPGGSGGRAEGEIVNVVSDEKAWRKQSYW
ncbi:hypothetical protein GGR56DRAFT_326072 [Xylariaceae sp. FL0804]|nr:hypothetical protein GGR56DRAFT_326072 [Xylariaceae sp. FL0804]